MSVTIRLSRQGAKKNPIYLIAAFDSESKRDGQVLEKLGQYFPKAVDAKSKITVKLDRVKHWQDKGAQTSQTVRQLLKVAAK